MSKKESPSISEQSRLLSEVDITIAKDLAYQTLEEAIKEKLSDNTVSTLQIKFGIIGKIAIVANRENQTEFWMPRLKERVEELKEKLGIDFDTGEYIRRIIENSEDLERITKADKRRRKKKRRRS